MGGLGGAQGQTGRYSLLLGPGMGPCLCLLPGGLATSLISAKGAFSVGFEHSLGLRLAFRAALLN